MDTVEITTGSCRSNIATERTDQHISLNGALNVMTTGAMLRMDRNDSSTGSITNDTSTDGPSRWVGDMEVMRMGPRAREYVVDSNDITETEDRTTTVYRMSTVRPIVSRIGSDNAIRIAWTYIPTKRIKEEDIRGYAQSFGNVSTDDLTHEFLHLKGQELRNLRSEVIEYGKKYIHLFFLEGFKEMAAKKGQLELVRDLGGFEWVKEYWATNCKETIAREIIGYMLHGYFDLRPNWEILLEREFMKGKRWEYHENKTGRALNWKKGCIAKIISETKVDQAKRIKEIGRRLGGTFITIKRSNPTKQEKNRKRKKGDFMVTDEKDLERELPSMENVTDTNMSMVNSLRKVAFTQGIRGRKLDQLVSKFVQSIANEHEGQDIATNEERIEDEESYTSNSEESDISYDLM